VSNRSNLGSKNSVFHSNSPSQLTEKQKERLDVLQEEVQEIRKHLILGFGKQRSASQAIGLQCYFQLIQRHN